MKLKKTLVCIIITTVLILQFNGTVFAAKSTSTKKTQTTTEASSKSSSYSSADVKLLACLIYTEAGNQSYKGKVAVGNVIMNRTKSKVFSHVKTIKDVIYDDKWAVQFGVTVGGSNSPLAKALRTYKTTKNTKVMKSCIKAAKAALSGKNVVGSRLYFTRYSKSLASRHSNSIKIGSHIFY